MAVKACGCCGVAKPATSANFHAHKRMADGLSSFCKGCAKDRASQWYAANKQRVSARLKSAYQDDPQKFKERSAARYSERHQDCLAYMARRRSEKAAVVAAFVSEWRARNKERVRAYLRNYKARRRGASGSHSGSDIKELLTAQQGRCAACCISLTKYHVDHVMPLILGGSNDRSNLQILCPTCNQSKGGKHPAAWAQYRGARNDR